MKPEPCPVCQRVPTTHPGYECCHLECPNRKPLTAAPPPNVDSDGHVPERPHDL